MLTDISVMTIKDLCRLAERRQGTQRATMHEPRHGPGARPASAAPESIQEWQELPPAHGRERALRAYLEELAKETLIDLAGLYRLGRGEAFSLEDAIEIVEREASTHPELVVELATRPDLAAALAGALARLQ